MLSFSSCINNLLSLYHQTVHDFKHLNTRSQIKVIAITALAVTILRSIANPLLGGIGGILIFRWGVKWHIGQQSSTAGLPSPLERRGNRPSPVSSQTEVLHLKQEFTGYAQKDYLSPGFTISFEKIDQMDKKELHQFVSSLDKKGICQLWAAERQAMGRYKSTSDVQRLRERIAIEIASMSVEQLSFLLPCETFWSFATDSNYASILSRTLRQEHFTLIAEWLKNRLTQSFQEVSLHRELNVKDVNGVYERLNMAEIGLAHLIDNIDVEQRQKELFSLLKPIVENVICHRQTEKLEFSLAMKICHISDQQNKKSLQDLLKKNCRVPTLSPSKKASPSSKKASGQPITPRPVYISPISLRKQEVRKKRNHECNELFTKQPFENLDEEVWLWAIETLKEDKTQQKENFILFVLDKPSTSYTVLERLSETSLRNCAELLRPKNIGYFSALENKAAAAYMEKSQIEELQRRLKITLPAIEANTFKEALYFNCFWQLITGLEYIETVAEALRPDQYGLIANWISSLSFPSEELRLKLQLAEMKDIEHLHHVSNNYFRKLVEKVMGDNLEQKRRLAAIMKEIKPHIQNNQTLKDIFKLKGMLLLSEDKKSLM